MNHFLALILSAAVLVTDARAAQLESKQLIQQAVEAYQAALDTTDRDHRVQLFRRAEALFERVIEQQKTENPSGLVSAALYVNLGNAALGAERIGPAVIAYRRALRTDPNHRRARQNLQHARTLLPQWIPRPDEGENLGSLFDWTRGLRPADWLGLAALSFLITMVLTGIYLRTSKPSARNLAILFGILWMTILARTFAGRMKASTPVAVVVVAEVAARAADSVNAPIRFPDPLPSGTEVRIVDDRDQWIRVRLFDSREAWLPASAIERV